jgi:diguanylate cyclase
MFSVMVGVTAGYFLGRGRGKPPGIDPQREATLAAILELLRSTEQLSNDVDSHSSQMQQVSRDVGGLQVTGEMQHAQQTVLQKIAHILKSNQRLEDDLVCARAKMNEQAEEIDRTRCEARTDALSGVANRKAFDERLQYLLSRWRREHKPFVLVLADIDHFKRINDTHGHQAGDRVVSHVGAFLRQCVRPTDYIARYGGDEFALLLADTELDEGMELVEIVRCAIARSNFDIGLRGEQAAVTFSIGVAATEEGDTVETIIKRADMGLYKSKQGGRNQVQCHRPDAGLSGAAVWAESIGVNEPVGAI